MPLPVHSTLCAVVASLTALLPAQRIGLGVAPDGIYGARSSERTSSAARARRAAIDDGLRWLTRERGDALHWHVEGADENAPATVAVTALAVLAFLADGNTMRSGPHKVSLKNGLAWLRQQQQESGAVAESTGPHLLATLAIVESYRLSYYKLLRSSAQLAVDHAATLRTEDGGWRTNPKATVSDPALSVWGAMTLGTAIDSDLAVPRGARAGLARWLRGTRAGAVPEVDVFGAPVPATRLHEIAFEQPIANTFARCWLAPTTPQPGALAALHQRPRPWRTSGDQKLSMVEQLFAALSLAQANELEALDAQLAALCEAQVQHGEHAGSWHPIGAHGAAAGRIGTTALALLALTADKRYAAPIAYELPPLEPDDGR